MYACLQSNIDKFVPAFAYVLVYDYLKPYLKTVGQPGGTVLAPHNLPASMLFSLDMSGKTNSEPEPGLFEAFVCCIGTIGADDKTRLAELKGVGGLTTFRLTCLYKAFVEDRSGVALGAHFGEYF